MLSNYKLAENIKKPNLRNSTIKHTHTHTQNGENVYSEE